MTNKYNINVSGNVGFVGDHNKINNITQTTTIDPQSLALELARALEMMRKDPAVANNAGDVEAVEKAKEAAEKGNLAGAMGYIKPVGKFAADILKSVLTEAAKGYLRLYIP